MMRSISFVKRLELEFPGNHFSHALSLGDVDNDGVTLRKYCRARICCIVIEKSTVVLVEMASYSVVIL